MNTISLHSACSQYFLLFCLTLILVIPHVSTTSSITKQESDKVALSAFKSKIIHDPQGVLNSWNDSHHFCGWEGITCGHRHRRVTALDLNSRGLYGYLSPYIGNLSFLRDLTLQNNSIQGEIPGELGRLFRLEILFLHNNSVVGEIPSNLSHCSRLTDLRLAYNKLVGKIPLTFASLYNLNFLYLSVNDLTGGIPPYLGNLTSLEVLILSDNPLLGGNIPNSLSQLRKLTILSLNSNNLSGTIPASLFNFSSLSIFYLGGNKLHGSLPTTLGLTLPKINMFQIAGNFISGSIPVSLSNASELNRIGFGQNSFSGKLSVDFGGMQHLHWLDVAGNNLGSGEVDEMNFINSLVNCSELMVLTIHVNRFRRALPQSITNLSTTLQILAVGSNQLHGSIPPGIDNLVNLSVLGMNDNQFSGTIPEEVGKLQNLKRMNLWGNQFSGRIPSSLGNLSLLLDLFLNNNRLTGAIPSSLGNLKTLTMLDISKNNLNGTISEQIFELTDLSRSLDLSQNQLFGSIPRNIRNLKVISKFDVSDNLLSGEIPNEIGFCSHLEYLYMKGNFFSGSIPSSMSSLRGIRVMDLSRNNLSGQIPNFLETLALTNLNLSFNDLDGEIPIKGAFANASAISVVGNTRLCGGITELQLPKCSNNDSKNKKVPLFIVLITTAAAIFGLTMMSFIFCWLKKRKEKQSSRPMLNKTLLKVSYEMLLKATDGFSPTRMVGAGSFGSVYKGILDHDGTIVAVKVLNLLRQGASKSFMVECKALRNIRHRNLVKVITSCSSIDFQGNDFKAIVYEFMKNGNLEKWLHPDPVPSTEEEQLETQNLSFLQRLGIAIDVASAVDYLHHQCQGPILHCDLKPSNVLLDNDMTAHVGDFGLVKFLPEVSDQIESSSVGVRGTIGYTPPEYGLGHEVSTYGDVYSYGILLLEMVTGKKPTDVMFEGDLTLHNFARKVLPDRVMEIVDPILINEEVDVSNHRLSQARDNNKEQCVISMVRVGLACSMESPQDRMSLTHAITELESVRNILLQLAKTSSTTKIVNKVRNFVN
ncbi:hypothetical protein Ddye_030311 [Dipteronia dyeriana]|uniref:non-specific serine/threonine protein kinase n=1 Tax=Dipteronia dyeriana TaxID=168575 RepID=A0AAD9WLD0_9ROSI|nr:hypothetical protein Ddye_030311 [Dipteronia dyeriana]